MSDSTVQYDVVVVGAGVSGLYALHHFRELGFTTHVIEAGEGVGGTWYWNRYPGARCDVPSMEYSYGFSPELEQEWEWTEVFPAQEELERYFNHVADRFDLRRDIQLGTRVTAATYDDDSSRWTVETDHGDRYSAQFLVMATGCLSAPLEPQIPGRESFAGISLYTNAWPAAPPDLTGLRVGLIGTGSSGVQATPELARDAAELYVFQRTPSYAWPAGNKPLDADLQVKVKEQYRDLRAEQRRNFGGVVGTSGAIAVPLPRDVAILEATPEERLEAVDELGWAACRAWSDVLRDLDANEAGAELYREMVRRVVADPETADGLSPRDLPIGCKRPILHTDYYETFNEDHVHLVDLRRGGIEEITPTGIRTAQGVVRARRDRLRHRVRRHDRCARSASTSAATTASRCVRRGPTARARSSACRPSGSRTSSPSPGPGARRCSRTWSCAPSSTSSGSATCSCTSATTDTDGRADTARRRTRGSKRSTASPPARCTPRPRATPGTSATTSRARCGCSSRTSAVCPRYIDDCDRVVAAGYEGFELS